MKKIHLPHLLIIFLPWIAYGILSSIFPSYSMLCGMIVGLLSYKRLWKGFILEWGFLLFFMLGFIYEYIGKAPSFTQHTYLFTPILGITVAIFSLLIHQPFTLQYAKQKIEKKYWDSPLFLQVNRIMTAVLGGIFAIILCINIFRHFYPGIINGYLVWIIALTAKVIFIKHFPSWYKARHVQKFQKKKELSNENSRD